MCQCLGACAKDVGGTGSPAGAGPDRCGASTQRIMTGGHRAPEIFLSNTSRHAG